MKKSYAILRVGKLTVGKLPAAIAHNQRSVVPKNADPSRVHDNIDFLAHDRRSVLARWQSRMVESGNPKVRANAVAAIELFMGYSPEAKEWIEPMQWGKDCVAFAAQTFGSENLISQVVHLDERTPHCSILIIPLKTKSVRGGRPEPRLAASDWIDGPARCRKMQDDFFREVGSKHNLHRGEEGSSRKHVPQSSMYAASNAVETIVADAVQSIPQGKPDESDAERDARIKTHLAQNLSALADAAKQVALLHSANHLAVSSKLALKKEAERRKKAEEEKQRAEEAAEKLKREYHDRLRDLPVSLVLRKVLGIQPRKEGNQYVFETPAFKISVHQDDRRFNFFKGDERGGSGAISAVRQVTGCDFREAIRWLAAEFSVAEVESSSRSAYENSILRNVEEAFAKPITLEEKLALYAPVVEPKWPIVREYLVRNRCLPGSWIDAMHRSGHVWANDHASACFAHRDLSGRIVGASIRGTSESSKFHQSVGSKVDGFFRLTFSKRPEQIAVVESPIEAVSLASLNRNAPTLFASTAGAGGLHPILDLAHRWGWKVIAAQNDDTAGEVQALHTADVCGERNLICTRVRPPFNDWNDTISFLHHELRRTLHFAESISQRLQANWRQNAHANCLAHRTGEAISLLLEPTITQDTTLLL